MERPFFNFICSPESWADVLGIIKEPHRFSDPSRYVERLVNEHGRPLFIQGDGYDFHLYPPSYRQEAVNLFHG